jgi:hypothetical protein
MRRREFTPGPVNRLPTQQNVLVTAFAPCSIGPHAPNNVASGELARLVRCAGLCHRMSTAAALNYSTRPAGDYSYEGSAPP